MSPLAAVYELAVAPAMFVQAGLSELTLRPMGFEDDIRPLFRPEDVEAMLFAFDLTSYEEVSENAEEIYARLAEGTMPCDAPWPEEDVAHFRAWIDDAMPQ
jgi:hypothetical protein